MAIDICMCLFVNNISHRHYLTFVCRCCRTRSATLPFKLRASDCVDPVRKIYMAICRFLLFVRKDQELQLEHCRQESLVQLHLFRKNKKNAHRHNRHLTPFLQQQV